MNQRAADISPETKQLVRAWLVHCDAEENLLLRLRELLEKVGLESRDLQVQRAVRKDIQTASGEMEELRSQRNQLLQRTAMKLRCPIDEVCVSRLAGTLSDRSAEQLKAARRRLRRAESRLRHLSNTIGWILSESQARTELSLTQMVGSTCSDRYDATGRRSIDLSAVRIVRRS